MIYMHLAFFFVNSRYYINKTITFNFFEIFRDTDSYIKLASRFKRCIHNNTNISHLINIYI